MHHDLCMCHLDQGSILSGEIFRDGLGTVENTEWRTFLFRPIENGSKSTSFPSVASILLHAFSYHQIENEMFGTIFLPVQNNLLHSFPCRHIESGVYLRAIDRFKGICVMLSVVSSVKAEYFVLSIRLLKAVSCIPSLVASLKVENLPASQPFPLHMLLAPVVVAIARVN